MTAASIKPVHTMQRLHLGCGESLSQLLPAEQPQPVKAVAPALPPKRPAERRSGGSE